MRDCVFFDCEGHHRLAKKVVKKNIAVVGCGYWGKNLVRNFADLDALGCICEPDAELALRMSEKFGIPKMQFGEVLEHPGIEGVVLAVPAPLHAKMAIETIRAGKHVFIEKPLAVSCADGEEMVEAALQCGVKLMVGHVLHYHPAFQALRVLCQSGALGEIRSLSSTRHSFGKVRTEEDVIWSFAPHDLSMILSIVSEPKVKVSAVTQDILQTNVADIASINLDFPSGVKASVSVSWLHPRKEQELVVIGDKGMAIFDDRLEWPEKVRLIDWVAPKLDGTLDLQVLKDELLSLNAQEPLRNECLHFMSVVNDGELPLTDGAEGLAVLKVLAAASESASLNSPVLVPL